jgi:peptidoglycan hydrolase CwlO-like protein
MITAEEIEEWLKDLKFTEKQIEEIKEKINKREDSGS